MKLTHVKTLSYGPKRRMVQWGFGPSKQATRFVVNHYIGKGFVDRQLEARAKLGLYYARAVGTHLKVTGEGTTPELALADLKLRALEEQEKFNLYHMLP